MFDTEHYQVAYTRYKFNSDCLSMCLFVCVFLCFSSYFFSLSFCCFFGIYLENMFLQHKDIYIVNKIRKLLIFIIKCRRVTRPRTKHSKIVEPSPKYNINISYWSEINIFYSQHDLDL